MLLLNIYRVCQDKGIENPHKFLRKNGFTPHTTSRILTSKVKSINFGHLEQLCLLLNCTPDTLFNWKYNDTTGIYKKHELNKLRHDENKGNILEKLKQLPSDKIEQIRNFIDNIAQEEEIS